LRIRTMTPADAPAIARLTTQLGYPSEPADIERRFALIAGDPDDAVFVAQAPSGQVVGWVHAHGRHLLEAEPFAEIGGLVVDEAWRGQGVGAALVAEAERWAAENGYAEVCVRSNTIREAAHRFYQRLGYRPVKAQQVFRKTVA